MELVDYLRMLRRRWVWVVGTVVVLLALALAYLAVTPKTYRATTDVFIGSTVYSASPDGGADNSSALSASNYVFDRIDTYAEMVDSPGVLAPVIKSLGLRTTPDDLAKEVAGSVVPSSVIVSIAVSDPDPERARDIAAETAKQFMAYIKAVDVPVPGKPTPLAPQVTVPATVPGAPDSPSRPLILALALLVGLGLGLVLASLRDQVQRGPRSHGHAAREADAEAVAEEPQAPADVEEPARPVDGGRAASPSLEEVLSSSRPRRDTAPVTVPPSTGQSGPASTPVPQRGTSSSDS